MLLLSYVLNFTTVNQCKKYVLGCTYSLQLQHSCILVHILCVLFILNT